MSCASPIRNNVALSLKSKVHFKIFQKPGGLVSHLVVKPGSRNPLKQGSKGKYINKIIQDGRLQCDLNSHSITRTSVHLQCCRIVSLMWTMGRWVPLDLAINHVRKIYQRSLKRFQHTISRTGGNTPMLTLTYKETPRPTTLYLSNRDAELSFLMIHIQVHNIRPPLIAIVTCIWIAMLTSLKFPSIGSNIMLYRYSFVQNAMAYTHHEEQPTAASPQWPTILRY